MPGTHRLVEAIRRDGYVVVPDLLSRREVAEIKESLAPELRGQLMGRNDFEGLRTERVYALLAKAPAVARIIEDPEIARDYSERIQELLGYDIFEPTFIGYVDGMHPKRLLDPEYAARRAQAPKIAVPD